MDRKEVAQGFLRMASSGRVQEAYDTYVARQSFKHHNPFFAGDAESLKQAMEDAHKTQPNKHLEIVHTIDDGNLVAVHSHVTRVDPKQPDIAVVHVFRFEGDRIAELWDVGQQVPKDSPNANGMF
jgi:predicted SnoaL-like aldol condensation-catalyzing enzyme